MTTDDELAAAVSGASNAREMLIVWANTQDGWVREIVRRVIASGVPLPSGELDEIYEILLAEKRLSAQAYAKVPDISNDLAVGAEAQVLLLRRISDVKGVNALSSAHAIEFDDHLTVLFGQNGSGKTGYSRVIKRAANVRSHEPVLGNVRAVEQSPDPSATIEISVDGQPATLNWRNELGLGPLQRVNVFDARATTVHVDDELGYVFTPAELALYAHCTTSIQEVQRRIDAEVAELRKPPAHALDVFSRGTQIRAIVESLGVATDLAELEALGSVPASSADELQQLLAEIAGLTGGNLDARLAATSRSRTDLADLDQRLTAFATFNSAAYETARDAQRVASEEVARVRTELFLPGELAGQPDKEWQQFATAAETYAEHLGLTDYPHDGDKCLYCRQDLSGDARALVEKYRVALDDSTQRQLRAATARLSELALRVAPAQVEQTRTNVSSWKDLLDTPDWLSEVLLLLDDASTVIDETSRGVVCSVLDLDARSEALRGRVAASLQLLEDAEKSLRAQRLDRARLLSEKESAAAELKDRIELSRRLPVFRDFVSNAKRAERLYKISGDISNRVRRSLTVVSTAASQDLANKNFLTLFDEECKALNAPTVGLAFQGRSGKVERRKSVAQHKPSAILSEGEQKVLALADFLAESRMNGTTAPIVFDDPVTSLDYRRMDEVSKRICSLAEQHQVIVFTHNIMFASALIAQRNSKKLRVKFIEVRENGDEKGVLVPDVEPCLDNPADIAKRVNQAIDQAKKADPAVQDALITRAYDLMRSWCEAFAEQELLANVTQRYRVNVMMTKLDKIKIDRLGPAVAVLQPAFEKICRHIGGHSSPFEQSNVHPTVQELEADWKLLRDLRDEYLKV